MLRGKRGNSKGYIAYHWCKKGHIVHRLEGDFISEMKSGEQHNICAGMSYIVSDEVSSHRSTTKNGVKLMIIDGDFLQYYPSRQARKPRGVNVNRVRIGSCFDNL